MNEQAEKSTEVAVVSEQQSQVATMISVIERAASNPDVDMDKMERLMAMQERMLDRNAEAEFADAMTRVQSKLPTIQRDADNKQTNSKYTRYETLAKAIKPIYTAEGFTMSFSEQDSPKENYVRIVGILRHRAGHKEVHHLDLPLDNAGIKGTVNKTGTHATGSTYSYGRRYLVCMVFDVATGDDEDGNQPIEYITAEQAADLQALMEEVGADKQKFLEYANVTAIGFIRSTDLKKAIAALEAKRK